MCCCIATNYIQALLGLPVEPQGRAGVASVKLRGIVPLEVPGSTVRINVMGRWFDSSAWTAISLCGSFQYQGYAVIHSINWLISVEDDRLFN
jgi:hypothetical protein